MKPLGLFLLIGAVVFIQSCGMHTRMVPVRQSELYPLLYKKPVWTIEDGNHKVNVIGNVVIRNDSVVGNLYPLRSADHPAVIKGVFPRSEWPNSGIYMHLNTTLVDIPADMAIPISSVTTAVMHDRDMNVKTVLLVLLGSVLFLLVVSSF